MAEESPYILFTGPYFLGNLFNWGLQGVLFAQFYNFWIAFPNERLRIFAGSLLILNVLHTIFATYNTWIMLVYAWGDPAAVLNLHWSGCVQPLATGIISAMVQIYFAWRIWVFKRENIFAKMLAVLIVLIALMQSLSAIVNGIRFALVRDVLDTVALTVGAQVWLAGSAACDVLISVTLIVFLSQAKRDTTWVSTQQLLTRLIIQSVETGSITALAATADLVLFLVQPSNNLHLIPSLPLGKLYTFVAFWTLNARRSGGSQRSSRGTRTAEAYDSHELSYRRQTADLHVERSMVGSRGGVIHISTQIDTHTDGTDMDGSKDIKSPREYKNAHPYAV